MTAAEWLTSSDPLALFRHLRGAPRLSPARRPWWLRRKATDPPPLPRPKLGQLLDAVIAAQTDPTTGQRLAELKRVLDDGLPFAVAPPGVFQAAGEVFTGTYEQMVAAFLAAHRHDPPLADAVRCLFADPFHLPPDPTAWRTPTVVAIAEGVAADAAFDRLPVLADALEDAGCDHEPLLHHLRAGGAHQPGCHALDAVLGRE